MEWQFEQYETDATWPIPYEDSFLLGVGSNVCCIEQHSGQLRWESTLEANITVRPSVYQDRGFVLDDTGKLYAFDISTGDLDWSRQIEANDAVPIVTDTGSLIATTYDGLVSLDADTGEYEWESELPSGPAGPPASTTDTVYTGTKDGLVYALSKTDGTIQWQTAIDAPLTRAGVALSALVAANPNTGASSSNTRSRVLSIYYRCPLPSRRSLIN